MNKIISVLLLCFLSNGLFGQINPNTFSKDKISVVGIPRGSTYKNELTLNGPTLKYHTPAVNEEKSYELHFAEFDDGKQIIGEGPMAPLIMSTKISSNQDSPFFEVVPDVSRADHFILFSSFNGIMTRYSHRFIVNKENVHRFLLFEDNKEILFDVEIPLLIVYESSKENDVLRQYLKKGEEEKLSMADLHKIRSAESPVKQYSLLYYIIK